MQLSLTIAFAAGLVSFLSPCVLPIIPGFLAYLAGTTVAQAEKSRWEVFVNTLFFVLGFAIVFAALGVLLNTALFALAYSLRIWLARIGGALIIFFGLYLTELIHIPWLEKEHKFSTGGKFKSRYATSFAFGFAFAAGWTPCVGPVLGGILGLAASAPGSAFGLLFTYSLGLSVPFLLVGLFTSQASNFINRYAAEMRYVNIVFGAILIALGVIVFTDNIALLGNFDILNRIFLK